MRKKLNPVTKYRPAPRRLFFAIAFLASASLLALSSLRLVSNPEFDDWSLVLTTSRGQVTMAPAVPPTLENISVLKKD